MDMLRGSIHAATTTTAHTSGSGGILGFIVAAAVFAGLAVLGASSATRNDGRNWSNTPRRRDGGSSRATTSGLFSGSGRPSTRATTTKPPMSCTARSPNVSLWHSTTATKSALPTARETPRRRPTTLAVCALALPAALPYLEVGPESVFARLGNVIGVHDIEIESEDFNRKFTVLVTTESSPPTSSRLGLRKRC